MIGKEPIKILLVEDEIPHAELVADMLRENRPNEFILVHSSSLRVAKDRLLNDQFDIVLLDLNISDSWGYNTFKEIQSLELSIPVILLTGMTDEEIALRAIQDGAQDFLVKGEVDSKLLFRSIRHAIERHQMQVELRSLSLKDELTGLYNRRGFLTLAGQHLKLARRTDQPFFIVFADIDDLKGINDTYGHAEGDAVLNAAAVVFRQTFREPDILARYGGDEFLALVTDAANDSEEKVYDRLQDQVGRINEICSLKSVFSISIGVRFFEPSLETEIEDLIARTDLALYKDKQIGK